MFIFFKFISKLKCHASSILMTLNKFFRSHIPSKTHMILTSVWQYECISYAMGGWEPLRCYQNGILWGSYGSDVLTYEMGACSAPVTGVEHISTLDTMHCLYYHGGSVYGHPLMYRVRSVYERRTVYGHILQCSGCWM